MAELDEIVVRITGDVSGLESAIGSANSQLSSLGSGTGSGAIGEFNSIAAALDNTAVRVGQNWKKVGEGVDAVTKPLQVASVAVLGLGSASAMAAVNFEDNFASVKKTVDGTPEQLDAIKQSIIDMTTTGINGHSAIPQTTAELTELAAAGGQLGIATENISDFTETMAMLGSATNLQGESGAATLARFMNVTNTSQDKIANLGSAIVDLGNNFATTEAEIANMALNMGATGNVIGISVQDVLAYSTALSSLGVEAMAGGSAVSRIWMDIQSAVSEGGKDLDKFAKISKTTSKDFAKEWKTDASKAFQIFLKGLSESEDQIGTLSDLGFNNIRDIQALQRLAGEKGLGLLTEALQRSNEAWEDNTALQTEFEAKADTTASKIAVAKNNAVEMARSFGEIMLPTIVDVTSGMSSMMQGVADWNDGSKKALITTGAVVVGLGALSKGAAGTIKTIGGVVEGVGKIKSVLSTGGTLAKFVPTLTAIGSAAGPAAIAVAGVGAAALITKAAYDAWYDSQYNWSKGLSEGNAKIKESRDKLQELSALRKEINDNQWIINNGKSSIEDVEKAKTRIEEIKKLLEEEYNLVIRTDNSNLDEALEKTQELTEAELKLYEAQQLNKLNQLTPKEESYADNYAKLEHDYNDASDAALKYMNTQTELKGIQKDIDNELISHSDALEKAKKIYHDITGETFTETAGKTDLENFIGLMATVQSKYEIAGKKAADYEGKMKDLKAAHEEYIAVAEELSDFKVEDISKFAQAQDNEGVVNSLKELGQYIKTAGLDFDEYARKASLAMNGLEDFAGAVEKFAKGDGKDLSAIVRDYSTAMDAFGATAEQKQAGLQSLADKFTEIGRAAGTLPKNKHIEITADGNVVEVAGKARESVESVPDEHTTDINVEDNTAEGVKSAKDNLDTVPREIPVTISVSTVGVPSQFSGTNWAKFGNTGVFREATGTQNFPGGLAKVNDQKGIADPRELIIDRGRAFIPEGKDVILPLSKGAKVYTAAQTKAIMSGAGIPHYASGKNNSDAFTAARDDWQHYTRTHAVTTAQELEKWLEFQEKYKENEKDIWDIEEQVFSLRQKQYSEQLRDSEKMLAHQIKYNGLSASGQMALIDDMRQYTTEAYEQGLIDHKEYLNTIAAYDEKYLDKRKEQIAEQFDISKGYISDLTYFNNWNDTGDSPLEAYNRVKERLDADLAAGDLTQKEHDDYISSLGSDMLQERIEQSKRWLDEQRKYFNMSDEDYAKGIERIKKYTQEYFDAGLIGAREFNETMVDLRHMELDEAANAYDEALSKQQEYISEMRDKFSKQEQELRSSWEVEDRAADMATVQEQLDLYSGAVTDRGQQKYKELQEELKKLQRDEELYNLQVANNATIESLEAEYTRLEADKKAVLAGIAKNTDIDVSGIVGTLTSNLDGMAGSITTLLQTLIDTVNDKEFAGPVNNNITKFIDDRTITEIQPIALPGYMGGFR